MKNIVKYVALVCVALGMVSCVQDLNTKPIDPNSSTSFNQERMFTKCYACMAVIGQSGPGEDSDVEDIDAGMSGFYRTIWYCNDLTTDEAFWIWDDAESRGLPTTNWTGSSDMIRGIYTRLNINIKYCNHYLTYASSDTDEDKNRIAEVRWIRAFHYFYLMDLFFYAPFVTEDSNEYPHFIPRHQLYSWLVSELEELAIELPDRNQKYRVDKSAAQLLLARIYLNADVYNKYRSGWTQNSAESKAEFAKAEKYADRLINDGIHSLVTTDVTTDSNFVYSAYQRLFMGDNNRDDIMKEAIFQIYQDGLYTQSHAGSKFLICGPRIGAMTAWGIEDEWHALRTSPTLIDKFLAPVYKDRNTAQTMVYNEYDMPTQLKDKRAIFCSDGENTAEHKNFTLTGWTKDDVTGYGKNEFFYRSWAGVKFTGVYSTASMPKYHERQSAGWPDTDIPMMRLAEAYLIRGEAKARQSGVWEDAHADIKVLRDRAGAPDLKSPITEVDVLDEWCREFWFEGRRRMDLVRFGRFFGAEADLNQYHWEGRMNKPDGIQNFISGTPEYMNWFPVPDEDKRSNPNFKTDVEENPENEFAAQGGDGYVY